MSGGLEAAVAPAPVRPGAKPTLAVVPFTVLGNVTVKDAGAILAERLLPLFGGRYTLVDQMQLKRFLDQDDLALGGLVEIAQRPSTKGLAKAVKLRAVRYLVVGSLSASPDGSLSVTARLSDWRTGRIESGRLAQIAGTDWNDLLKRLPLLAAKLTGSLGEIGPGPAVALPPLPSGVSALKARVLQLEAIEAELKRCTRTLKAKHPRIPFLRESLRKLGKALIPDVDAKLAELQAADAKLADLHKETHPRRQALREQIAELRQAQAGVLARACPPKELTLTCARDVTMKLVLIPSGKFPMGSPAGEKDRFSDEGPQRRVTISKPFHMGVHEVTQDQYAAVMGKNPSKFSGLMNPVEQVSWEAAVEFCRRLAKTTGWAVRLPTEAEWEYACRAGSKTRFSFGDGDRDLGSHAWYSENSDKKTHPVSKKKPNAWGLYDMHGNVYEWCSDWHAKSYAGLKTTDPQGPGSGKYRVLRGGAWHNIPQYCRSAYRGRLTPGARLSSIGFRVVMSAGLD